jgi:hypothetical protein
MFKKFKLRQNYQSIDESKLAFLRQQYRINEELRDILAALKVNKSLPMAQQEQRFEQTKDFIDSLYDKQIFNQLLWAAELKLCSQLRESKRSYKAGFNKTDLMKNKDKLEKELGLIKTLLDI